MASMGSKLVDRETIEPASAVYKGDAGSHTHQGLDGTHRYLYRGPPSDVARLTHMRLYGIGRAINYKLSPLKGLCTNSSELRLWKDKANSVISQNSSKRCVHKGVFFHALYKNHAIPVAIKFVSDGNCRDGRSLRREIECHLFIQQRLQTFGGDSSEDAWPSSELLGYHLDKAMPGRSVMVTRKLSGPDFFDVIRTEHTVGFSQMDPHIYEAQKLQWVMVFLERVSQYASLGVRHNDIKPDNVVLDFHRSVGGTRKWDVKLIDLGTASLETAREFTGGTSWYESPEQKQLEFWSKKMKDPRRAAEIEIDLSSDAWGAGLTATEVLLGRRVVDAARGRNLEPLCYTAEEGAAPAWRVSPKEWVRNVRDALKVDDSHQHVHKNCALAAKVVFDLLVHPAPSARCSIANTIPILRHFVLDLDRKIAKRKAA